MRRRNWQRRSKKGRTKMLGLTRIMISRRIREKGTANKRAEARLVGQEGRTE